MLQRRLAPSNSPKYDWDNYDDDNELMQADQGAEGSGDVVDDSDDEETFAKTISDPDDDEDDCKYTLSMS